MQKALLQFLVLAVVSTAAPQRRAGLTYGPAVVDLTPSNFEAEVDDGSCAGCGTSGQGKVFVVDFYAAW